MSRTVVFDLDGTLYDKSPLNEVYFPHAGVDDQLIRSFFAAFNHIRDQSFVGDVGAEEVRLANEATGLDPRELARVRDRLFGDAYAAAVGRQGPREGLRELLTGLVSRGCRVAVLSDRPVPAKIAALGLDDLPWSVLSCAQDAGCLKPNPRAFEAVRAALGASVSDLLYVGDRADIDYHPARALGWQARLFSTPAHAPEGVPPQDIARSMEELAGLLSAWLEVP